MSQLIDIFSGFLEAGGPVLWVVFVVAVALWALIIERCWFYRSGEESLSSELVREWELLQERKSWNAARVRESLLSRARTQLEHNLALLRVLVTISPLLGLLGTVTGMIEVFDVMALSGTGNARLMAAGVSQATVPTMAGMVVALVGLFFLVWFELEKDKSLHQLSTLP